MPLPPGTRLGHFEILAPLGAGGMGEVYRARDPRLGRDVAVKVLPQHLSERPEMRARFEREARAVSALNHPHICTVYDVGVHEGQPYLVMELLSGQALTQVINKKPLAIDRLISFGEQAADALDLAHRAGIVHRDLKPANLFVTDRGDIKVLDFGLAKLVTSDSSDSLSDDSPTVGSENLTEVGTTVGTVAYMSPEQARNEPVDARSDLFSLGVVLYEMATGRRPFEGKSPAELFAAILKSDPTPPGELSPEVPPELEAIILKALEKDPALRYDTAAGLRGDLLRLRRDSSGAPAVNARAASSGRASLSSKGRTGSGSRRRLGIGALTAVIAAITSAVVVAYFRGPGHEATGKSAAPQHSIAVLPFTDMSPGKDQEYFSDGISEELLNLLARVPQLQVTARTSSFSFKGKEIAIPEIARRLHVTHVLEGSVRKAGNQVRITAQLIDAATDTHLWSGTYDRTLDNVFAIQDEIAADVVRELKLRMLGEAPRVRETDPAAYALYLEAMQLLRRRTPEGYTRSDSLFERVLAIDPRYAPAWTNLASNRLNESLLGMRPTDKNYQSARDAARRAIEIDPEYGSAHAMLGTADMLSGDLAGAAPHFERALELAPTDLAVLSNSAAVLKSLGRLEEALALSEAIVRRDPVNSVWLYNLACTQNWAGRYDESIGTLRTVLSLTPGYSGAHLVLGEALIHRGKNAEALAEVQQEPFDAFRRLGLAMAFHALGRKSDADTALTGLIARYASDAPYDIAYVYAVRGERDRAFEWLDKSAAAKDPSLTLILVENLFDSLHSDARWLAFLRRIGKDPEVLGKIAFKMPAPTPR